MADAAYIHADALIIDGLQRSDFDRSLLEEALRGGVTAINHTASYGRTSVVASIG